MRGRVLVVWGEVETLTLGGLREGVRVHAGAAKLIKNYVKTKATESMKIEPSYAPELNS